MSSSLATPPPPPSAAIPPQKRWPDFGRWLVKFRRWRVK